MKYIHMSNLMNYVKLNRACQKEEKKSRPTQEKRKNSLRINRRANHLSQRNLCPYTLTKVYDFYINQMIIAFVSAEMKLALRGMSTIPKTPFFFFKTIFKDFCLRRWSKDRRCSSLLISQYTVSKLLVKMCEAVNSELSIVWESFSCDNHEKAALREFSRILTSSFFSLVVCECCQ